ncbi:MAG: RusA family crossover junction endodeoxyribonuclease [Blautia sp.]|nr:RusA family crossover junction endodeoxyribonuclease [Blautia sp.]
MGKQRARTFWNNKLCRMQSITPKATASYEGDIKLFYQHETGGEMFEKGIPIAVELIARFEPANSESKKRKSLMVSNMIRYTKKPDIDNIAKAALDALNGLAWHDDSQVVSLLVRKRYCSEAGLDVIIKSLDD